MSYSRRGLLAAIPAVCLLKVTDAQAKTLLEEFDANIIWQWENNPPSVALALRDAGTDNPIGALQDLQSGQTQSPQVQTLYQLAVNQYGQELIYTRVAQTTNRKPDFAQFKLNTDWQFNNNIQSLIDSNNAFNNAAWEGQVLGMGYLTGGQAHNPSVCVLYTACWASDPERVKRMVEAYFFP